MKKELLILISAVLVVSDVFSQPKISEILNIEKIAETHYGNDHKWYENNIPFFECSDKTVL